MSEACYSKQQQRRRGGGKTRYHPDGVHPVHQRVSEESSKQTDCTALRGENPHSTGEDRGVLPTPGTALSMEKTDRPREAATSKSAAAAPLEAHRDLQVRLSCCMSATGRLGAILQLHEEEGKRRSASACPGRRRRRIESHLLYVSSWLSKRSASPKVK